DGQHTLDLRRPRRHLERGKVEEGSDGRQPTVATAGRDTSILLQVVEERPDQRRIDIFEGDAIWRFAQPLARELEQQAEGVAVRADRVRTCLPLLHKTFCEEALQQCGKTGRCFHRAPSQCFSRRSTACPISSGKAVRYQKVSLTWA